MLVPGLDIEMTGETHQLLVDPLQLLHKLVVKLDRAVCQSGPTRDARKARQRTILKCTGGPPNDVKPRYQVSLTVFHTLTPILSQTRWRLPGATQDRSAIMANHPTIAALDHNSTTVSRISLRRLQL
jgi:hypothetical protein